MRTGRKYGKVLAVLGLATVAGAVHAREALRTMAVAAFPDVTAQAPAAPADPAAVEEGADLNSAPGPRRAARQTAGPRADLLPNPYGPAVTETIPPPTRGFDERVDKTYRDERWSDPYPTAQNTYTDESWSNPYVGVERTRSDERWFNPYVNVTNTLTDERWSNPYGTSVSR